jgi:hypothetical protein
MPINIRIPLLLASLPFLLAARPAPRAPAAGNVINLPYAVNDNLGNQWMIQQNGQFQQQGDMPVFGQGAMLQINGAFPQPRGNRAKLDPNTGELLLENINANGLLITRHILVNKPDGYVRYIDIFKNTQNQNQTVNLALTTNVNFGIQSASLVPDPRKDQNLAWVAQTQGGGRTAVEIYAGRGAKLAPNIQYVQDENGVHATLSPVLAAGKEIALMHFHATAAGPDAGTRFVLDMKESRIMATIPAAIRRLIVNFRGGENFIGDYEILRGDAQDIVELRSGDQLKGALKEKTFKLETFYGPIELPVEKVIGFINAGEFRPRQLLVTKDGEVFGGKLDRQQISLELSSGQAMEIPLSQISRLGYRKRPGEPDEWTFDKPLILMRSGDRIAVQPPASPIEAVTRYGLLKLNPASIAAIDFQPDDHRVHQIFLTDGSQFAGLITAPVFEMKLAGDGPTQSVKFPASGIKRLQLGSRIDEPAPDQAQLTLANEDAFVGALTGDLKLDTAFNTLALAAEQIKRLAHPPNSSSDVQITLWDDTTVSGQLQEQELTCQLKSGLTIKVPVALVQEYLQPRPAPSPAVIDSIKQLVLELGADDWKKRDQAQEKLVLLGPASISTLRQLRDRQPPEAQQRIDLILKRLEKPSESKPAAPPPDTPEPMVPPVR